MGGVVVMRMRERMVGGRTMADTVVRWSEDLCCWICWIP